MGKDASDAFENADKVLAAYDKQNIVPGTITPALAEYGVTLLGNYRGLPLYASESQYTDVDGSFEVFRSRGQGAGRRIVDCKAPWPMPESFRLMKRKTPCIPTREPAFRWSSTKRDMISGR